MEFSNLRAALGNRRNGFSALVDHKFRINFVSSRSDLTVKNFLLPRGIDSATTTAITTATDKLVKVDPAAVIVEDLDKQDNKQDETIMVSRDAEQMKIPLEDMTGDQIRAKLYKKHGTTEFSFDQG